MLQSPSPVPSRSPWSKKPSSPLHHARTMTPGSLHLLCSTDADLSLKKPPRWDHPRSHHRAQAPIKTGGFGIRDPVLHLPTAFLATSSSTCSLCNSLWSEHKDTHDLHVTAGEKQFRTSVWEMLRGAGTARHTPRATCPTCATGCWFANGRYPCYIRRTTYHQLKVSLHPRTNQKEPRETACGTICITSD